jgi:metal-sulfur cluster biosynthetic enzyme
MSIQGYLISMKDKVLQELKTVSDPEISLDIVELGLIYDISFEESKCNIVMTLTTAWCPVAQEMPVWVKDAAMRVSGVDSCEVTVTFEPPWTHDSISEAGKLELGLV